MSEDQATRGGMWDDRFALDFHCAYREVVNRLSQDDDLGFRIASRRGPLRVLRGGSRVNDASYCRSACRIRNEPNYRYDFLSFRLARRKI